MNVLPSSTRWLQYAHTHLYHLQSPALLLLDEIAKLIIKYINIYMHTGYVKITQLLLFIMSGERIYERKQLENLFSANLYILYVKNKQFLHLLQFLCT